MSRSRRCAPRRATCTTRRCSPRSNASSTRGASLLSADGLLVEIAFALLELALVEFALADLELSAAELGFALVELLLPLVELGMLRGRLLALPTLELGVQLFGTAVGDDRSGRVARRVLDANRAARRRIIGGARAPIGFLRTPEQQPDERADVGQDDHEDDPHG